MRGTIPAVKIVQKDCARLQLTMDKCTHKINATTESAMCVVPEQGHSVHPSQHSDRI